MISNAFRAYMEIARALSADSDGQEILVGLSGEETRDYLEMLDRKADSIAEDERFMALHRKHELARIAAVSAEVDLSSYVREPQDKGRQSQEDAFHLPLDGPKR